MFTYLVWPSNFTREPVLIATAVYHTNRNITGNLVYNKRSGIYGESHMETGWDVQGPGSQPPSHGRAIIAAPTPLLVHCVVLFACMACTYGYELQQPNQTYQRYSRFSHGPYRSKQLPTEFNLS